MSMDWIFIAAILGIFVGWKGHEIYMAIIVRKIVNALTVKEVQNPDELSLFTVVQDNNIFAYKENNDEFMGQARSLDELAGNLLHYKKIKFAVVNHNDERVFFVEGKVKTTLTNL